MLHSICFSACKLESNFKATKNTYVCSRHFKRDNFTSQVTGKIVLKCLTTPSIFPWNKSSVATPKSNNSPASSKPSTPPPTEKKNDSTETPIADSKATEVELVLVKSEKTEEKTPAVVITTKKRVGSSLKKSTPLKISLPKSVDKPTKMSKRLSAKHAGTVKVKTVAVPPETPERVKAAAAPSAATPKKKNQVVNFVPGSSIEAQNFDGKWMPVKVIEVDMEEREVLVRSCDKNNKSKTG